MIEYSDIKFSAENLSADDKTMDFIFEIGKETYTIPVDYAEWAFEMEQNAVIQFQWILDHIKTKNDALLYIKDERSMVRNYCKGILKA